MNVPPIARPVGQNVVQPFRRWQQVSQPKRAAPPEELARSVLYLASAKRWWREMVSYKLE
jgi:hypothetical protein